MRRTFAVALAAGVLLVGGCDRQHAQSSGPPAATHGTAPTIGKSTSAGGGASSAAGTTSAGGQPTATGADDVNSLLSDVDKQLNSDSQPTKEAD